MEMKKTGKDKMKKNNYNEDGMKNKSKLQFH